MNRSSGDGAAQCGTGIRVLVVDDDTSVLRVVSLLLRQRGFQVSEAATGEAAREHAEQRAPDVALVDVRLRGGCGLSLAAELESRYGLQGRVALMTGGERPGPGPCLLKPFDRDQLVSLMCRLGQGAPAGDPPTFRVSDVTRAASVSSR